MIAKGRTHGRASTLSFVTSATSKGRRRMEDRQQGLDPPGETNEPV